MNQPLRKSEIGLYIGCGTDFKIIPLFANINSFIYIDSQPLTSYGDLYHSNRAIDDISKTYMHQFKENANQAGFIKISIDSVYPHVYRNYNTCQEIYHYFNLCFPIYSVKANHAGNRDEITKLLNKLKTVTHIIVIGYSPHYSILKYISNPVCFVGDNSTIYKENLDDLIPTEYEKITVILQKNLYNIRNSIKEYIYIDNDNFKHTLKTYEQFISSCQSL